MGNNITKKIGNFRGKGGGGGGYSQRAKKIKGNHEAGLELLYQYRYTSAKQQWL